MDGDEVRAPALTFLGPGVILPEGVVFVDVGVQVLEGVLWDIFSGHDLVVANDVGECHRRELFLRVGLHRVEVRL